MIEWVVRTAREEAIVCGVTPESPSRADNGFPKLWAITWRVEAAAWMYDSRNEHEAAMRHYVALPANADYLASGQRDSCHRSCHQWRPTWADCMNATTLDGISAKLRSTRARSTGLG